MVNDVASQKSCILLVDDHPLILAGLSQLINKQPDLICCGVARTIANAREEFAASRPDLVTIDLGMPDGDSVQLIKDFTSERPSMPILVVSQWDETIYAERVLKAGARGYVMKERCAEDILVAIRTLLTRELFVSQKVAVLALRQMAGRKNNTKNGLEILTNRELQVLQMLGLGLGTRVISVKLSLSIKTVETHRENIKHKLGIRDATALMHYAINWVDNQNFNPPVNGEKT